MLYIIDTANVNDIRRCNEFYPIDGVTTNPTIIAHEKRDFIPLIKEIRTIIGDDKMFHIQTTATTAEEIVKEGHELQEIVGGEFYLKIPVSPEGLKATRILSGEGIKVTETAIFTQQQALIAAKAGASFVAPYVNRLDNIVSDGAKVVEEITEILHGYKLPCKVLAASFKNVEQIHKISTVGGDAVTITPDLFDKLVYHPLTYYAIDDFEKDWESIYGDKSISELISEYKG